MCMICVDLKKDKLIPLKHFDHSNLFLKVKGENPSTFLLKQEEFKRAYTFEYNPKRPLGIVEVEGVTRANRYKKLCHHRNTCSSTGCRCIHQRINRKVICITYRGHLKNRSSKSWTCQNNVTTHRCSSGKVYKIIYF